MMSSERPLARFSKPLAKDDASVEQGLRQTENTVRCFTYVEQSAARFRGFHPLNRTQTGMPGNLLQTGAGVLVFDLGNSQPVIAFQTFR